MINFRTIEASDPRFSAEGLQFLTAKSPSLKGRADVTVYIPPGVSAKDLPVIFLLHGVYGSHWSWALQGGAHLTLQVMIDQGTIGPFVLVMPSDGLWGDGSGYVPHHDLDFQAWIGEELPDLIRQQYEEVGAGSRFFIGGLSMGGYGAFRVGLKYPETFRAISAHSAVTGIDDLQGFVEEDWSFWDTDQPGSVTQLIKDCKKVPPLRFDCGDLDELFPSNQSLHRFLTDEGVKHQFDIFPGEHNWPYWQEHVKETFKFFDKQNRY